MNISLPQLSRIRQYIPWGGKRGDPRPAKAWFIILVCGALYGMALSGYSAILYIDASSLYRDTPSDEPMAQAFDVETFTKTVDQYRERSIRFETLRRTIAPPPNIGELRPFAQGSAAPEVEQTNEGLRIE